MDVCTGVVIPLLSALISGGLTLIGVYLTLRKQRKSDLELKKLSVKPWLLSCAQDKSKEILIYKMIPEHTTEYRTDIFLESKIKNTDNGIAILDCVRTENCVYYPAEDYIVDKNTVIKLVIYLNLNDEETLKQMYLYVSDVYGNHYRYPLVSVKSKYAILGKCEEV